MRLLGFVLLLAGIFLCLTIVWATIGFLMMGFGLICLLIAERQSQRRPEMPVARNVQSEIRQEPVLMQESRRPEPTFSEPKMIAVPSNENVVPTERGLQKERVADKPTVGELNQSTSIRRERIRSSQPSVSGRDRLLSSGPTPSSERVSAIRSAFDDQPRRSRLENTLALGETRREELPPPLPEIVQSAPAVAVETPPAVEKVSRQEVGPPAVISALEPDKAVAIAGAEKPVETARATHIDDPDHLEDLLNLMELGKISPRKS